jgi:Family of unknown function (DUF6498)
LGYRGPASAALRLRRIARPTRPSEPGMTANAASPGPILERALSRPDAIWILLSNAIPVAGVVLWGWPAFSLLLFYWIETVVIGAFNLLKLAISGFTKPKAVAAFTVFLLPFFVFHYGLFCFVHGTFVMAMFSVAGEFQDAGGMSSGMPDLISTVWRMIETDADLRLSVASFVAVQAGFFTLVWLGGGAWRKINPLAQMMEPYGRILVMHFTIFVATIPVLLMGQGVVAVLALAVMKCALELGLPEFDIAKKLKDLPPDKFPDAED